MIDNIQIIMQQEAPQKRLKTLLCQIKPILKQKKKNITRVQKSLQNYSKSSELDVIFFPQMSFIGYNFQNQQDALPYSVKVGEGQQFQFCSNLSKRTNAYVIYGYIEKQEKQGKLNLYNSASVLDRNGKLILNYRKTHLYYCDKLWCEQGEGFKSFTIQNKLGQQFKCALCICMDINPKDFTSGQYQFADFALKQSAQVIFFCTNWVDSSPEDTRRQSILAMLQYWAHRMRPMLPEKKGQSKSPFLFLAADRVGEEYSFFDKKNTNFFGCSCAIMFNPNYLVKNLGKKDEGYLLLENYLPKKI